MEIEEKKDLASSWFRNLRDQFCKEFETLDGSSFERTEWSHSGSGGGEISIMKGNVFEKVGVNISTVSGEFKEITEVMFQELRNLRNIGLVD